MSPQKQGSSLENFTFYLSLLLLAAAVGSFFYLKYSVDQSNIQLAEETSSAAKMKSAEEKDLETRILTVRQQLRDFSTALAERKLGSNFFGKFEKLVYPDVYFTKCGLSFINMAANLSGHASNFEALGRQVSAFETETDVFEKVTLGGVTIGEEGGVDFDLKITIKPAMVAPGQQSVVSLEQESAASTGQE